MNTIWPSQRVEWLEFVQAANSDILANFEKAITKEAPYGYFVGIARMAMRNCINGSADLIKTHSQMESIHPLSLDAPLADEGKTTTLGALLAAPPLRLSEPGETKEESPSKYKRLLQGTLFSQALTMLTDSQRKVMACLYGLEGQNDTLSWTEAGRLLNISEGVVSTHHRRACTRLRAILLHSSPENATFPGVYTTQQAYAVLGARDRDHFWKIAKAYHIQPCARSASCVAGPNRMLLTRSEPATIS